MAARLTSDFRLLGGTSELCDILASALREALSQGISRLVLSMVSHMDEELASPEPSLAEPSAARGDRLGIGPQYRADLPFKARMRLHQSWYRSEVLRVPLGTGPKASSETFYGNMLDASAADQGMNFLTPRIADMALRRIAEDADVEPFRCRRNMLSSQPMCFNLFGTLVDNLDLAGRLFRALFPGEVDAVMRVLIEHAPSPKAEYLGDGTSFGAFVEYRHPDGGVSFVGIETKLADEFSPKPYDRPRYRELTEAADSPWPESSWPLLADGRWNQLWRNQLLCESLLRHPASRYATGRSMLVRHPGDEACSAAVAGYRGLVARQDSFVDMTLDRLVAVWEPVVNGRTERAWLTEFTTRYVALDGSEHLVEIS